MDQARAERARFWIYAGCSRSSDCVATAEVERLDKLRAHTESPNLTVRDDGNDLADAEDATEGRSADQNLRVLWPAVRLAQEVGACLGDDLDLLRPLPRCGKIAMEQIPVSGRAIRCAYSNRREQIRQEKGRG